MSIFDDIRLDREAGTLGPWYVSGGRSHWKNYGHSVTNDDFGGIALVPYSDRTDADHRGSIADARRIARVPDLERIALAAEELAAMTQQLLDHVEDPDIERPTPGQCTVCYSYRTPVHLALAAFRDTTR